MPMPKGTKPRVRNFAEVSYGELQTALRLAAKETIVRSNVEGKRTVWRDKEGNVIARHNVHKRSEQIVVAAHLYHALPKPKQEKSDAE